MTKPNKIFETASPLYEQDAKPKKSIFITYQPHKKKYVEKKMFKLRKRKDYSKYEKSNMHITRGYWAKSDHKKFIDGLYLYDCDWKKIQAHIKNRTYGQVRSHAQKFYLKLKTFKDEELELDFTNSNVKSLSDIIKIIKEKELKSKNYGKLLHIISKQLSFGKNIFPKEIKNSANVVKTNQLNNNESKSNNIYYFNNVYNINNVNNYMQMNYEEMINYMRRMNEQFLNSFLFDNLLIKNILQGQILNNNIVVNNQQKNDKNGLLRPNILGNDN